MRYLYLCFLLCALASGCRKPQAKREVEDLTDAAAVQALRLQPRRWRQDIRTFGVFEAAEKVTISGEFSGKVTGVYFSEGDEIEAGQKLVEFDVSERKMRFKQAEGNLVGAKAELDEARSIAKRREELFKKKAISKEQYETAKTRLAGIEAQYEQLLVGRSLARHQLRRTRLTSPVSGTVVSKTIDEGEVAMPGQTLAVIQVTDTMRVITHVTQEEINTIQIGTACEVTTPGVRGRQYTAHVEHLSNAADPSTGNFPIKLTVNNDDGLLRPGMSATIKLTGLEVKDAILIPDTAVVDRNRKRVVYLADDNIAKEVEPILAATTGDLIPVLHGLEVGDEIIVGGLDNVTQGTPLKVDIVEQRPRDNGDDADTETETPSTDQKRAAQ